jgi:hypothetical protein
MEPALKQNKRYPPKTGKYIVQYTRNYCNSGFYTRQREILININFHNVEKFRTLENFLQLRGARIGHPPPPPVPRAYGNYFA